jgi:hypothetical protein
MKLSSCQESLEQFINRVLLRDLALVLSCRQLRYLGFALIAGGIEFLGACTDRYPFEERGRSEKRFRRGIEHFLKTIDTRYAQYNIASSPYYLYRYLRHAMVQSVWQHSRLALMTRGEASKDGNGHLVIDGESRKLVLVDEDFYADFALACDALKAQLSTLVLRKPEPSDRGSSRTVA